MSRLLVFLMPFQFLSKMILATLNNELKIVIVRDLSGSGSGNEETLSSNDYHEQYASLKRHEARGSDSGSSFNCQVLLPLKEW